jgi:16S rRNA processing protein RimM
MTHSSAEEGASLEREHPHFITVGKVKSPHGVCGEVRIVCLTDYPSRFQPGLQILLSPPLEYIDQLTIEKVRWHRKSLLIKFKEISSRSEAERLKGRRLVVPKEETVKLPADTFWIYEIIGLEVYTADGQVLGKIVEVLRTTGNDVYVVKNDREYLIPATKEVVKQVDLKKGRLIIEPITGLLE